MRIAYADGPLGPRSNPADIATLIGHTGQFELFLGWMIDRPEWLADPTLTGRTYMAGFAMTRAVAEGRPYRHRNGQPRHRRGPRGLFAGAAGR